MRHRALILIAALASLGAVEIGPVPLVSVHDGDTLTVKLDGKDQRVRLLYVDTAEVTDNDHGQLMKEGETAKVRLNQSFIIREAYLWGPGDKLAADRYGRLLAYVVPVDERRGRSDGTYPPREPLPNQIRPSAEEILILAGQSVYWRKYGDAPEPLHSRLLDAQAKAEAAKAGAWTTAPQWMKDKSNERTPAKD